MATIVTQFFVKTALVLYEYLSLSLKLEAARVRAGPN
jgi:hypothetical protein